MRADLISAELEDHTLASCGALGDAILIDREAVRDVLGREGDLHEIVLLHLNPNRFERELIAADLEFPCRRLLRRVHRPRGDSDDEQTASQQGRDEGSVRDADHWAPRVAGPHPRVTGG